MNKEELNVAIGLKVKQIRKLKGMSQDDLALAINITRTSIVNIEKGRQALSAFNLYSISEVLKINPAELFPQSDNSISILIASEIHNLKNERDDWKSKYNELVQILSKLKEHIV